MVAKNYGNPTQKDLDVTAAAVTATLKDKLRKQEPSMLIYTLHAAIDITCNSIFMKNPKCNKIAKQKMAFLNRKICHIRANISKKIIIKPTKAKPFFASINGILLLGACSSCCSFVCNCKLQGKLCAL